MSLYTPLGQVRAQDIVVATWDDAEAAVAFLKQSQSGRATFLPLDSLRPGGAVECTREARTDGGRREDETHRHAECARAAGAAERRGEQGGHPGRGEEPARVLGPHRRERERPHPFRRHAHLPGGRR